MARRIVEIPSAILADCVVSSDYRHIANCLVWYTCSGSRDETTTLACYPRDAMLARVIVIATCLTVCPSICPSVRLSRAGIVSKRRKLATWFLRHLVAPRL